MKWITTNHDGYVTTYTCPPYTIRHRMAGCGIYVADALEMDTVLATFYGDKALDRAMEACERHASPIPECDFMAKVEGER